MICDKVDYGFTTASPLNKKPEKPTNEAKRRDAHITSVIADMLNQYSRVMIVYGAGHLYQQEAVLEKMLGRPIWR